MFTVRSSSRLLLPICTASRIARLRRAGLPQFPLQSNRPFLSSKRDCKRLDNFARDAGRPWTKAELQFMESDNETVGMSKGDPQQVSEMPPSKKERQRWNKRRGKYAILGFTMLICVLGFNENVFGYISPVAYKYLYAKEVLEPLKFTPFTIVRRDDVSPTSFIVTLRPTIYLAHPTIAKPDPYRAEWEKGTWSVEFKQPELQIARSYTPLPPREGDADSDLRFLIRREINGEMSRYIARLPVGAKVELRGPQTELELPTEVTDVVFLAGGTGIAPALQVVHTLLKARDSNKADVHMMLHGGKPNKDLPSIYIVWANRRREDCAGANGTYGSEQYDRVEGIIVRELRELQQKYPDKVRVVYLVDDEGTILNEKMISKLTKRKSEVKHYALSSRIDSRLLIVSGPEGFVNFVAGPKKFLGGTEVQGIVGGLIGKMGIRDWKVWKQ